MKLRNGSDDFDNMITLVKEQIISLSFKEDSPMTFRQWLKVN
ncbi:MAG: hypothetical protein ACI9EW_002923 [Cellvibrionaceae bacterium]|jgi:hypothetical protein